MPHINTAPGQHDHTVSAYIVRTATPEPTIMLHRHKKLGKYMQFGGHIELDENPWQAITHELAEESGYDMAQLQILQPPVRIQALGNVTLHPNPVSYLTHQFEALDHHHTDIAFAFVTDQQPRNTIADGESQTLKLFTAEQIKSLSDREIYQNIRQISLFCLEICINKWQALPTDTF